MRYSFMSFSSPESSLAELLSLARGYGYGAIEPRIDEGHAHGIELDASSGARRQARRQVEESGLAICCIATDVHFADPTTAPQQVEAALRAIELAADLGSPVIRVFGGKIPESVNRAQAIQSMVESLQAVAPSAHDSNVTVCVETHDDWSDPRQVAKVMQAVDEPAAGVVWDVIHPLRAKGVTMEEAFTSIAPWVRHVHVHDGLIDVSRLEYRPMGEGQVDHRPVIRLLREAAYGGWVSGEWIKWEPAEVHLPREIATLRSYEREVA